MLAVVLGRISVDNVSEAVLDNITKVAIGEADRLIAALNKDTP